MIILEGPDGMGKSTLAKYIAGRLSWTVNEIGKSPGGPDQVREYADRCVALSSAQIVQDRVTQISEWIYGKTFDRPSLTDAEFLEWQRKMLLQNPVVIYCRVNDLSKVTQTREEYDTEETIQRINDNLDVLRDRYDSVMWGGLYAKHLITYDYTNMTQEELYELVLRRI